jgi:hypothetical protein
MLQGKRERERGEGEEREEIVREERGRGREMINNVYKILTYSLINNIKYIHSDINKVYKN